MSHLPQPQNMSFSGPSSSSLSQSEKVRTHDVNPTGHESLIKRGKRIVGTHKFLIAALIVSANWWWPKYFYVYIVFISLPLALNCVMIFNIICWQFKNHFILPPKRVVPSQPETMVLLVPCYNETREECTRSLDSLVEQTGVDQHQKAIMVVCDGKVRGPGMEKTCGQYLNEDILVDQTERKILRSAYVAWDGHSMDVEITKGTYRGIPFFCLVKQQNQGKRDSLIVARSFVHKFNQRLGTGSYQSRTVFHPVFLDEMTQWLSKEAGIKRVDFLIGMDADTVFAPDCISHLVKEAHHPGTVGVCGYVAVDFSRCGRFNPWSIYQATEYNIAQGLRRLHQSVVTHKVSCLPGCCQLLRVCEETCGDRVLVDLFGYHPSPVDGMLKRIRATASEDRNHVCLMLMETPRVHTRQALFARAYTEVPRSLSVFLSQRRRWTLGATANDLMLVTSAPWCFNPWERLVALTNVMVWCLNIFVVASIASMVNAFLELPLWIIMSFASVMLVPVAYYATLSVWLTRTTFERVQYLVGLVIFVICGPFINIGVSIYAIIYMDNFSWGKTRQVITDDDDDDGDDNNTATMAHGAEGREKDHHRHHHEPGTIAAATSSTTTITTTRTTHNNHDNTPGTTATTLALHHHHSNNGDDSDLDFPPSMSTTPRNNRSQDRLPIPPPLPPLPPPLSPERAYLYGSPGRRPDEENQLRGGGGGGGALGSPWYF